MKKKIVIFSFSVLFLTASQNAFAVVSAGNAILLAKLLQETTNQLLQLKKILQTEKEAVELTKEINRGIQTSVKLLDQLKVISPDAFKDLSALKDTLKEVETLYGKTLENQPTTELHKSLDQSLSESIYTEKTLFENASKFDRDSEFLEKEASSSSPGRAQKLSAVLQAKMLRALSELQKSQATLIKIQSQELGLEGRDQKLSVKEGVKFRDDLSKALTNFNPKPKLFTIK